MYIPSSSFSHFLYSYYNNARCIIGYIRRNFCVVLVYLRATLSKLKSSVSRLFRSFCLFPWKRKKNLIFFLTSAKTETRVIVLRQSHTHMQEQKENRKLPGLYRILRGNKTTAEFRDYTYTDRMARASACESDVTTTGVNPIGNHWLHISVCAVYWMNPDALH